MKACPYHTILGGRTIITCRNCPYIRLGGGPQDYNEDNCPMKPIGPIHGAPREYTGEELERVINFLKKKAY